MAAEPVPSGLGGMGCLTGGIEGFKACLLNVADNDFVMLRRGNRDRPLAFTFLGVVLGPPMFGALSGLFGTYRAGFVGLMVMACISGTVLFWTQRPNRLVH